ncbi:MAG TPA: hypothetical protein VNL39_10950 [Xanthobacteraceae bacterium]|nr:hypothetical protein [Xanthobacteraceae bacterium]
MARCTGFLSALIVAVGLLHAPQVSARPVQSNFYVSVRSACYAGGPQQGRPPEAMVPAGAVVKIVPARPIGSYRRVETESGLQCWIDGSRLRLMLK